MAADPDDNYHNLFESASGVADDWAQTVTLALDPALKTSKFFLENDIPRDDIGLTVSCIVTAAGASFRSISESTSLQDAYFVGLNLVLTPHAGKSIQQYRVTLRPLQDDTIPVQGPDATITSEAGIDPDVPVATSVKAYPWGDDPSWSSSPLSLPNATWSQTQPTTVDSTTSITTSNSFSVGANAGFFGETPTAGITGSYSLQHSTTTAVPAVKISNETNENTPEILDVRFQITNDTDGRDAFQPYISGILLAPDDGQGVRSNDPTVTDARCLCFELRISALPQEFDFLDISTLSIGWIQVPTLVRTFKVRMPPPPTPAAF